METKWVVIGVIGYFAALSAPQVMKEYQDGNAKTACYQMAVEAIKAKVEPPKCEQK